MTERGAGSEPTLREVLTSALRSRDRRDPYAWVRTGTDRHRRQHGCWAFPYADGTVIGALAAALGGDTVLELGTALGYTACWWASAAQQVDTVEIDPVHVALARDHVRRARPAGRVTVHEGDFSEVLPDLRERGASYDFAFFDGYDPPRWLAGTLDPLVGPGGAMVVTNLDLGAGDLRRRLSSLNDWQTEVIGDIAVSRRR